MHLPSDPRLSFNEAADVYDEIRPNYPALLFSDFFKLLPDHPSIIEVGPGTGQATRDLLVHGASVLAVEIGPAMAARLRSNLKSARLEVLVGDFEQIPVETESCDAVFSATAYHWISATSQLDRPASLLRPGGVLGIVELHQVDSPEDDNFFEAVQPIYDRYGQGHKGPPAPTRAAVSPAIGPSLTADRRFVDVASTSYDWNQTYTADEYRRLMLSYSVTQMMEPAPRVHLLDDIELFVRTRFGNRVVRPIVVTLTTARLRQT